MAIYLPVMLDEWFREVLNQREDAGLLRKLRSGPEGADFSSNDYLGLARSSELHERIHRAHSKLPGNGATGSRLLSGTDPLHLEIESELATRFGSESSLLFASGYMANLGVLASIPQRGDTILYDELSHASIKDGIRLSNARIRRFRHNDPADLDRLLKKSEGRKFVVVESVYSMDGDFCDFEALIPVIKAAGAYSIVDEAHATGVYGPGGSGLTGELDLFGETDIRIYTFGKAMGIHGACIAGSRSLVEYLINYSRPFIYTTGIPPIQLASIREAFLYLDDHTSERERLNENIELFTEQMKNSPREYLHSKSAIQGIVIPGNEACRELSSKLNESGFSVYPVLSPTVPEGSERIRICLHSYNTRDEIISLISKLSEIQ